MKHHILSFLPGKGINEYSKVKESLHGLFAHSVPQVGFSVLLSRFLKEKAYIVLGIDTKDDQQDGPRRVSEARQMTTKVMKSLSHVGLAGGRAQRLFAEVMSEALTKHIETQYSGKWTAPSQVSEDLRDWIENQYARFIVEILACVDNEATSLAEELTKITHADVQRWQGMAISHLGALRVSELFDVVVECDIDSRGALEDLKSYVNNTNARLHLTRDFSEVLSHRLLQPGASTTQILQVYISIIRSFTFLDPKGVLLDRVARPIRRYLREREDTVHIVVGGLLADPEDESPAPDVLMELAIELDRTGGLPVEQGKAGDDGELDWDDMTWVPDPIDAPPGEKHLSFLGSSC